jgi:hypothetical protein
MLPNKADIYRPEPAEPIDVKGADRGLQAILWTLWTVAVVATAGWNWRLDVLAARPINLVGMVIYSLLTGLIGMLVITVVELWLEPQRFID